MKNVVMALLVIISAGTALGEISVYNFEITTNTISFDLAGEIESGVTIGSTFAQNFYIGSPGDDDWVLSFQTAGTVENHGGGSRNLSTGTHSAIPWAGHGDFILLQSSNAGSWFVGDSVDASVTITGSNSFVPGNLPLETLIVAAGYNSDSTLPDPDTTVGAIVIPEPGSAGLFGIAGLVVLLRRSVARRLPTSSSPTTGKSS